MAIKNLSTMEAVNVKKFIDVIQSSESVNRDPKNLLTLILSNIDMKKVLIGFLNISRKNLKIMASFYGFEWTDYVNNFLDVALKEQLIRGGQL